MRDRDMAAKLQPGEHDELDNLDDNSARIGSYNLPYLPVAAAGMAEVDPYRSNIARIDLGFGCNR